jgi:lipopolysaccharide exporter
VMLGAKWIEAIPLVTLLAIAGAGLVLQATTGSVYNALGLPRQIALTGAIHAAVLVPLVWYATPAHGLHGVAWATLIYSWGLGIVATYVIFLRSTPVTLSDVVSVCWRPILGCGAMSMALVALSVAIGPQSTLAGHLLHLLSGVVVGATAYLATVAALWMVAGRPAGAESLAHGRLRWFRSR